MSEAIIQPLLRFLRLEVFVCVDTDCNLSLPGYVHAATYVCVRWLHAGSPSVLM